MKKDIMVVDWVIQRFIWVSPGVFLMGSPENEAGRYDDEEQHVVHLTKGYWLADTACTQRLWETVMNYNNSCFKGDDLPVGGVSYYDCQEFIGKVNKKAAGYEVRLPTEAEWEYACRAGTTTRYSFGDAVTSEQINFGGKRHAIEAVKSLPPNPWGFYEMHGNAWEWCSDWYGEYETPFVADPQGPNDGAHRVLRGGSRFSLGMNCRSADRNWCGPGYRLDCIGFRLCLEEK